MSERGLEATKHIVRYKSVKSNDGRRKTCLWHNFNESKQISEPEFLFHLRILWHLQTVPGSK